jgi:hypothetical protein
MSCVPVNPIELPGSNASCATLTVRECLTVNGVEITGAGSPGSIDVLDEGGFVPGTPFVALNFLGAGVTATPGAPGQADITVPGASPTLPIVEHLSGDGPINPLDDVAYLLDGRVEPPDAMIFTLADSAVDGHQLRANNVTPFGGSAVVVQTGTATLTLFPGEHLGMVWNASAVEWFSDGVELTGVQHDATLIGNGSNAPGAQLSARSVLGTSTVAGGNASVEADAAAGDVLVNAPAGSVLVTSPNQINGTVASGGNTSQVDIGPANATVAYFEPLGANAAGVTAQSSAVLISAANPASALVGWIAVTAGGGGDGEIVIGLPGGSPLQTIGFFGAVPVPVQHIDALSAATPIGAALIALGLCVTP